MAGPRGTNPTNGAAYQVAPHPSGSDGFALQGILGKDSKARFANLTDGTSNTPMVGEVSVRMDVSKGQPPLQLDVPGRKPGQKPSVAPLRPMNNTRPTFREDTPCRRLDSP